MSDAIEGARKIIQSRLREIGQESQSLERAIESFGGAGVSGAGPGSTRRSRKRAPRGQRRVQFLAAVKAKPDSTAAEIGKAIGVSTNQAYALGQRLLSGGEVKKNGKGFKPV